MARDFFEDGLWHSMSKNARPRWTLTEAQLLFGALSTIVRPEGWGVSLYGSVLRGGEGRDLDLLFTPSHHDATALFDLALVYLPRSGLTQVGMPGYGHRRELGVVNWVWEDEQERVVDMAFWPLGES